MVKPLCGAATGTVASPEETLVELHPAPLEQPQILLLEAHLAVMHLLALDVPLHSGDVGWAHREPSVSLLPAKKPFSKRFTDPEGGGGFNVPHNIGEAVGSSQSDEQVNVVVNTPCLHRDSAAGLHCTTQKRMESASPFFAHQGAAVFGAENEMIVKAKGLLKN